MDKADKVTEDRLRRVARRRGLRIVKSRRRDPHALDFGHYLIVSVATGEQFADCASMADVETWLDTNMIVHCQVGECDRTPINVTARIVKQ